MNDLIDRQAAIDAIRASTKKYTGFMEMEMYTDDDAVEAIEGLPPAQPEPPTDDTISRRAAIDAVGNMLRRKFGVGGDLAEITIADLPSAQPDIIHCVECKYYHDSDGCFFSTATTGADGFCHWAERKEGEADEC